MSANFLVITAPSTACQRSKHLQLLMGYTVITPAYMRSGEPAAVLFNPGTHCIVVLNMSRAYVRARVHERYVTVVNLYVKDAP